MSEHCDDDGKGGCKKHPPTMRLVVNTTAEGVEVRWWALDLECPARRCCWPARVENGIPFAAIPALAESMASAYNWLLHPKLNLTRRLRRVRAAEKLRAKGKVTPGVVFEG